MNYEFLIKAQSQPDLADFCEYLKKPLSILEDIQQRYKKLQLNNKVKPENVETYHKVDSILEKHLPDMVDNFCDFSFDFRNNKKLDMDGYSSLTAKELLLKNLAKVIEEIEIIEKDFNKNNSFHAVVQNKILNSYGYKPELCLETGSVVKKKIELNNQFDYEKFVEENKFKKQIIESNIDNDIDLINDSLLEKKAEVDGFKVLKGYLSDMMPIFIVLLLTILTIVGLLYFINIIAQRTAFIEQITNLRIEAKNLYRDKSYADISTENILKNEKLARWYGATPWKAPVIIASSSINKPNDAFVIEFNAEKGETEQTCRLISRFADKFEVIKVNDFIFKNHKPISQKQFESYCDEFAHDYTYRASKFKLISK